MRRLILLILTIITLTVLSLSGCDKNKEITIYSPDGAPALALTTVIKSDIENVSVNIVSSDKIASCVTGKNKLADVCILPINLASKVIGDGKDYKMLGTITHGNFYFLSRSEVVVNKNNVLFLKGETIGVLQLNNVPGLTLKSILKSRGLDYKIIENVSEKDPTKVNLMAINKVEASRNDIDLFLIPSPNADALEKSTSLKIVGSLGELYSDNGFPQAIIVAKNSVIDKNSDTLKKIISNIKTVHSVIDDGDSAEICSFINSKLESGLTPVFNKNNLTKNSIERSNINFVSCSDNKETIESFLDALISVEPSSVQKFSSDFYYLGEL